ncbi:hypothetical protein FALBO_2664 [Fusarium albosuccineum]|uniref:Uncharacterized protein n=1 Tax=Fusarium albosuccineum TaxID=1237068 RepID=A0A8H4LMB7_9HYPO|nr:hypothetical protein FALBO_2664 [Fusarium albosuccineum]
MREKYADRPVAQALYTAWQFAFAIMVFIIFVVCWLVQGETINVPDWTNDLRDYDEDDWQKYSTILICCVLAAFAVCVATGVALIRSDSNHGYT